MIHLHLFCLPPRNLPQWWLMRAWRNQVPRTDGLMLVPKEDTKVTLLLKFWARLSVPWSEKIPVASTLFTTRNFPDLSNGLAPGASESIYKKHKSSSQVCKQVWHSSWGGSPSFFHVFHTPFFVSTETSMSFHGAKWDLFRVWRCCTCAWESNDRWHADVFASGIKKTAADILFIGHKWHCWQSSSIFCCWLWQKMLM